MLRRLPFLALLALAAPPATGTASAQDGVEFFEKKIRPVLVEHCDSWHSAKKHKGELALDSKAGIDKGGESGPVLVRRKPGDSLLLKAVRYTDRELKMPPKGKLPAEVIADLEKWVAMGAPDPRTDDAIAADKKTPWATDPAKLWAFRPPQKQPVPEVKHTAWPRGPIDRFLLAKLEEKHLTPAADADRAALLRRAYFDLIGLPPTPEQTDSFVRDPSPDAFAKVVDRLLASPHYGERWGRHWLDV